MAPNWLTSYWLVQKPTFRWYFYQAFTRRSLSEMAPNWLTSLRFVILVYSVGQGQRIGQEHRSGSYDGTKDNAPARARTGQIHWPGSYKWPPDKAPVRTRTGQYMAGTLARARAGAPVRARADRGQDHCTGQGTDRGIRQGNRPRHG